MTKRTRKLLFLFLVIIFIVITPLTVFYSLGWRIDWKNKKLIQPGILYLRVWPKSVQIYLDGKLEKKTDFFFGSALIENLLPKRYNVEIKKEGFQVWKKALDVDKGMATEAKNIILIPESINLTNLSKDVDKFFMSRDEKKMILQESNAIDKDVSNNPNWSLKIFDLDKNIKIHLIEKRGVSKENIELVNLVFSPDSKNALLETRVIPSSSTKPTDKQDKIKYYVLGLDKTPLFPLSLNFLDSHIEDIYFNPADSSKIFFLESNTLSEKNINEDKLPTIILKDIITFSISNGNVYYLDSSGNLFKTDYSFSKKDKLNKESLNIKKEGKYKIIASNSYIFLKEDNVLYQLNNEKNIFEKISEAVNNIKFSSDLEKIAYFNDREIWVMFLRDRNEQPKKKMGEKLFLTRFSEKIDKVFWFTNDYLIFSVGNKLKIVEIDDRDKINIFDLSIGEGKLSEFNNPEFVWSQINKKLFILIEKNIYSSDKLIP